MRKTAVIGNAGGGKTTLCETLQRIYDVPYYSIDNIQWKENWSRVPVEEVRATITEIMDDDNWIIDGWGPWETIEERFKRCDSIVFVDLPLQMHLWWALKRQMLAWIRPSMVKTPKECSFRRKTMITMKTIYRVDNNYIPKLRELVYKYADSTKIYHLKSKKALKQFLKEQKAAEL